MVLSVAPLGASGRPQELLPVVVAAKMERLSVSIGDERGRLVHGRAAFGIGRYLRCRILLDGSNIFHFRLRGDRLKSHSNCFLVFRNIAKSGSDSNR